MIKSGDKNVNVVEIINQSKDVVKPTGQGIPDDYIGNEGIYIAPRDEREHNPLPIINSDEKKPTDKDDINIRLNRLESDTSKIGTLETRVSALENSSSNT